MLQCIVSGAALPSQLCCKGNKFHPVNENTVVRLPFEDEIQANHCMCHAPDSPGAAQVLPVFPFLKNHLKLLESDPLS